jgi:signal transduction histidine kinase
MTPLIRLVLVTSLVVLASTTLGAGFALSGMTGTLLTSPLIGVFRAVGSALFLGAGVLRIARWRVDADPVSGLLGTALLMYGGAVLPLTSIASTLSVDQPDSLFAPLTRWVATAAVLVIVARALWEPDERRGTGSGLVEIAARAMTVAVVGFFGLLLLHLGAPSLLSNVRWLYLVLVASLAVAWLTLGAVAALRGSWTPWTVRMAPILTSLSVAELLRLPGQVVWTASAALLTASIGALIVISALHDLIAAVGNDKPDTRALTEALQQAREIATAQDEWRAEVTHDARNSIAGLRATLETLEAQSPQLDPPSFDRLRLAAIDELRYLEQMIASPEAQVTDFDVAAVVRSAVDVRRTAGLDVAVHCTAARARGNPGDLARVLQNLLVNAQLHAKGARVSVKVTATFEHVEIHVADEGPGVRLPGDCFGRGVRGSESAGSGLGLAVSRTLMRRHGGDLVLQPRSTGAVFTVRLPRAAATAKPLVRQRRPELVAAPAVV